MAAGNYDLTNVAVHEIGHCLGLGHSSVATAMMFATTGDGDQPHELDPDDIAGMRFLYPAPAPAYAAPQPPPRRGGRVFHGRPGLVPGRGFSRGARLQAPAPAPAPAVDTP